MDPYPQLRKRAKILMQHGQEFYCHFLGSPRGINYIITGHRQSTNLFRIKTRLLRLLDMRNLPPFAKSFSHVILAGMDLFYPNGLLPQNYFTENA